MACSKTLIQRGRSCSINSRRRLSLFGNWRVRNTGFQPVQIGPEFSRTATLFLLGRWHGQDARVTATPIPGRPHSCPSRADASLPAQSVTHPAMGGRRSLALLACGVPQVHGQAARATSYLPLGGTCTLKTVGVGLSGVTRLRSTINASRLCTINLALAEPASCQPCT